jgi:hypothetical protein
MITFVDWQITIEDKIRGMLRNIRIPPPEGFYFSDECWIKRESSHLFLVGDKKGIFVYVKYNFNPFDQKYEPVTLKCIGQSHYELASRESEKSDDTNYFDFFKVRNEYDNLFQEILSLDFKPPYTAYNITYDYGNATMFLHEFISSVNERNPKELELALLSDRQVIKNKLGFSKK